MEKVEDKGLSKAVTNNRPLCKWEPRTRNLIIELLGFEVLEDKKENFAQLLIYERKKLTTKKIKSFKTIWVEQSSAPINVEKNIKE